MKTFPAEFLNVDFDIKSKADPAILREAWCGRRLQKRSTSASKPDSSDVQVNGSWTRRLSRRQPSWECTYGSPCIRRCRSLTRVVREKCHGEESVKSALLQLVADGMNGHLRKRRRWGHWNVASQVLHELTRPRREHHIPIANKRQRRISPSCVRDAPLTIDIVNDDRVDVIQLERGLPDRGRAHVEVGQERDRDRPVVLRVRYDTVRASSEPT